MTRNQITLSFQQFRKKNSSISTLHYLWYRQTEISIHRCGGFVNQTKAACNGDSGGGFIQHDWTKKRFEFVGIISASLRNATRNSIRYSPTSASLLVRKQMKRRGQRVKLPQKKKKQRNRQPHIPDHSNQLPAPNNAPKNERRVSRRSICSN
jgi:hypothetical protein